MPTKADIVKRIAARLGVAAPPMSSGSTEPRRIFEIVVEELGLAIEMDDLTKPDLAHAICDAADLSWSVVTCESTGGTVTKAGLILTEEAVSALMGG